MTKTKEVKMKKTMSVAVTALLVVTSVPSNLLAQDAWQKPKVTVRKLSLVPASSGAIVKRVTVNRPQGWLPEPQVVKKVREISPNPKEFIDLKKIGSRSIQNFPKHVQAKTALKRKEADQLSRKAARIFGGIASGIAEMAAAPFVLAGCGCDNIGRFKPINTTFEPITVYVYDDLGLLSAYQTLYPGETGYFRSMLGSWTVEVYGEYTQSWILDGYLDLGCNDSETWYIADPFAAVDVTNFTARPVMFCANDFYCDWPAGIVDSDVTMEFYFLSGTYEFTFRDAWEPAWIIDVLDLTLYSNEVVALDVTY